MRRLVFHVMVALATFVLGSGIATVFNGLRASLVGNSEKPGVPAFITLESIDAPGRHYHCRRHPDFEAQPQSDASPYLNGGVLNSKAVSLPSPAYPPIAMAARAFGTVVVEVVVNIEGNVVSAHAVSGHPLLMAAAVEAAKDARFSRIVVGGQPVLVKGLLIYNFSLPGD